MTYSKQTWTNNSSATPINAPRLQHIEDGIAAVDLSKVDKGALVISVKEYGAVGNGTTDDTAAIQAGINACESTGSDLLFPAGRYKVTAPLLLPVAITIRGVSNASGGVFSSSPVVHNCIIETYTGTVFAPKGTAPQITRLAIQDLEFTNKQSPIATYGPPSVLFSSGITLSGSKIERITAFGYGTIFAGPITIVSVVSKCFFIQVWTVFNGSNITDSQIKDNYISGTPSANATGLMFDGATAMSVVSGNFIEFMKYGIQWTSGAAASNIVTHNRFDYCYRAIGSTAGALSGVVISNNLFHMSKQTNGLVYLTAPDTAMSTNPWVAIDAPAGITYTSIVGNFFDTGDTAISVRGYPVRDFTTSGNGYRNVTTKVDYLVQLSGNPGDQTGIHITELDRQKVTTLPSPSITGSTIVSFDRQQLYVNGKLVFNNAGTWVDAIGASSSTYNIGTAPQVDVFTAGGTWTKPAWASTVSGVVIAGGGGSGSGRRGAAGTIRGGGGGGGGAGVTTFTMAASALTSTVAVTVGPGGTAGAAVTIDNTNGNTGGTGTASTFGAYARATGGTGGGGGTVGSGSAGTGGLGTLSGGPGVASSSSGGVGNSANGSTASTVGGASGGGITVTDVPGAGGTGVAAPSVKNSFRAGGVVDGTAPNGADAGYPNTATFGGSGGGGAASITTTAQNGTSGGIYGGGASGGGASLNGNNSGAGQVGGDGIVVIIST